MQRNLLELRELDGTHRCVFDDAAPSRSLKVTKVDELKSFFGGTEKATARSLRTVVQLHFT